MLQSYRFSGAFKFTTLTKHNLYYNISYTQVIHNLLTVYTQAKNTYKLTIMKVLNN